MWVCWVFRIPSITSSHICIDIFMHDIHDFKIQKFFVCFIYYKNIRLIKINSFIEIKGMNIYIYNFFFFTFLKFLTVLCGMWYLSSPTTSSQCPQQWKHWVLTTELPGKSRNEYIFNNKRLQLLITLPLKISSTTPIITNAMKWRRHPMV